MGLNKTRKRTKSLNYLNYLAKYLGSIPAFDELLPWAQPMVRELGIYRDQLPAGKESV